MAEEVGQLKDNHRDRVYVIQSPDELDSHIKSGRKWVSNYFLIDKPRIVVAVMIDEPSNGRYYGGDVAAPVFSQTVQQSLRLLGVQPDMSVKPQIVANGVEETF